MANTYLGLSDLITLNDKNALDLGCNDLFDDAPFSALLAATPASNGTQHKYTKQTGSAGAGFRAVNAGLFNSASTNVQISTDLKILDASFAIDKAEADGYFKGAAAYVARELRLKLRAAFFANELQIINGTVGGSAAGFTGFADATTLSTDAGAMVINAGGSTSSTGSSVYLVRTNDAGVDTMAVVGNGGSIQVGETIEQQIVDGSGKPYMAYVTSVQGWTGLQFGSLYSVARIANLTTQSTHTLTDAMISQALALFPAGRQPNVIVMGRRSLQQLQASRTATNTTGAPAPIPQDSFGIKIVASDACTATEAILAVS